MKLSVLGWICVLGAGTAQAATVTEPAGWKLDASRSASLTRTLGELSHFGGLPSVATAYVYTAPTGGALYVTRVTANASEAARDAAASAQLDELVAAVRRQGATPDTWDRRALDGKLLESRIAWRDARAGLATEGRTIVAGDLAHLVAVSGECVLAADAPADVATACKAALATLDTGIDAAARVELKLAAETPPVKLPATTAPSMSAPAMNAPIGQGTGFEPIEIPPAKAEPDRRPIYVGAGLIVLALVFWWNRKQREQVEREHGETPPRRRRARDADAEDLHAAAEAEPETNDKEKK